MKKIYNYLLKSINYFFAFFVLFLVILNIHNISKEDLGILMCLGVFSILIVYWKIGAILSIIKKILNNRNSFLWLCLILCFISIIARFTFLNSEYIPFSDPEYFYSSSKEVSMGNFINGAIEQANIYPWIFGYTFILSKAVIIFKNIHFSIILLNTIIDILSSIVIFLILKNIIKLKKKIILGGAVLWFVNPFNIAFSVISLPIGITNLFILLSILGIIKIIKSKNIKELIFWSLISGLIFGLGDAFRPFFVVFNLAIVAMFIFKIFSQDEFNKKILRDCVISILLAGFSFTILSYGYYNIFLSTKLKGDIAPKIGGSNIYIGSNFETGGRWNNEDDAHWREVRKNSPNLKVANLEIRKQGIERYKKLGFKKFIILMTRKVNELGGKVFEGVYNLSSYPKLWASNKFKLLFWGLGLIYYIFISLMASRFTLRNRDNNFAFLNVILFLGFFIAFLSTEVASRYFIPFIIFLHILTFFELNEYFKVKNINKKG